MYKLMKEQTLTFIADLFLTMQETSIDQHDLLAESNLCIKFRDKNFYG